jgi:hypothetical protein
MGQTGRNGASTRHARADTMCCRLAVEGVWGQVMTTKRVLKPTSDLLSELVRRMQVKLPLNC